MPSERKMKSTKNRIRRKEDEKEKRTRKIKAKLEESSPVLKVRPSSRMSSGVLEHVYDWMCMCVATMKVMNGFESFRSGKGCRVKEVS